MNNVMATGGDILEAMLEGIKCHYNRSAKDGKSCMNLLRDEYEYRLAELDVVTQRKLRRNTKNSPLFSYLPISLALVHEHKAGTKCEPHARVYLASKPYVVFDIPMQAWDRMCSKWQRLCDADSRLAA